MIRRNIPRKLLEPLLPKAYYSKELIMGEIKPFLLKKIKEHEENLG